MRVTSRRTGVWALAGLLLLGPAASMTGHAATCPQRVLGKDAWTRIAAPEFPASFEGAEAITGHAVLPSKTSTLLITNGVDVLRSVDDGCTWSRSELIDGTAAGPATVYLGGASSILELDTSSFSVRSKRVYLLARGSALGFITINDSEPTSSTLVYVSDDGGASFTQASSGLPVNGEPVRLRVADGVDNVAYVSITDPVRGGEALYVTRNWGESWSKTTGDTILPTDNGSIVDFAVDPGRPDQVWAWDETTLYRSTNAGKTFTPVREVIEPVSTVEFTPRGVGRISDVRVYHLGTATSDFSVAPSVAWKSEKAPAVITSSASIPYGRIRLLGSAQQVFAFVPNTRTQSIMGPIDVSPTSYDPVDLEGGWTEQTRTPVVVGRTASHLLVRDPRLAPPPLPPIGRLGECVPPPLGDSAFRPSTKVVVLRPGERRRVGYDLNLPPVPSDLDVNFMLDTTGSMGGVIAGLREDIKGIVENICDEGVPVEFGLADFREHHGPWSSGAGLIGGGGADDPYQYPYKRRLPISPVGPALRNAIGELDTGGGATDGSDSGLDALYQAATGNGRKDPVNGKVLIRPGLSAEFRPSSLKVIVVAIDTSWREETPGYPGPAFETVARELRLRGIKVIGLAIGENNAIGHLKTNKQQLGEMATATGTLAPPGGTDCDADGTTELNAGDPLVCVLHDPGRDSVELGPAMTGLLGALQDRASIGIELVADPTVLAAGGTQQRDDIDVKKPSRLAFDSWFVCDEAGFGRTFPVEVNAVSRGRLLAKTSVVVRCGAPKKPLPPELPPKVFIAPVVAAAIPPPPPPPAPVTVTQTQPNPNPNPNPQPNPQIGMVAEHQEQIEVALATIDIDEDGAVGPQLAMSSVQSEDQAVQVAAALLAVGLTAGAAYGLGYRRRPEVVPAYVRSD
ncbi:MAG TPA: hypothetical protein VNA14_03525 [Mycobacteriales bacterium]|nr:hypothetical protein [Mycobacteriales bacterium]